MRVCCRPPVCACEAHLLMSTPLIRPSGRMALSFRAQHSPVPVVEESVRAEIRHTTHQRKRHVPPSPAPSSPCLVAPQTKQLDLRRRTMSTSWVTLLKRMFGGHTSHLLCVNQVDHHPSCFTSGILPNQASRLRQRRPILPKQMNHLLVVAI